MCGGILALQRTPDVGSWGKHGGEQSSQLQAGATGSGTPSYTHGGTLVVTTARGDSCSAQFRVTSSLMYPFVAPVFHVSSASCKVRGAAQSLSAARVAEIEARVNVSVSERHAEEPLPAQAGVLCAALAEAAFGGSEDAR